MVQEPIRVFIGSGEASRLERKTLQYSIQKHTKCDVQVNVFLGTHDAILRPDGSLQRLNLPLEIKTQYSATEFSHYRYLIPDLCDRSGRAIWLDSDMICLKDIAELFFSEMDGNDFLALADGYSGDYNGKEKDSRWGTSVLLLDCSKCHFPLTTIFEEISLGKYDYYDFSRFSGKFLRNRPYKIGQLDPRWNSFDFCDADTRLIHYTKLETQPWKFPGHPFGNLWFRYFNEAVAAGIVTEEDIRVSKLRAYVRQDLHLGNSTIKSLLWQIKKAIRDCLTPNKRKFAGAYGGARVQQRDR